MHVQFDPSLISMAILGVSTMAFVLSVFTAWFGMFHRGRLCMIRPSAIVLMHDRENRPRLFVRSLLYSTGNRGRVIRSLYLTLRRGETVQTFSIFDGGLHHTLKDGAGLIVFPSGAYLSHIFKTNESTSFEFWSGAYKIEILAEVVDLDAPVHLFETNLIITKSQASALQENGTSLFFEWGPGFYTYHSYINRASTDLLTDPAGRSRFYN
ncbi:MAG: hypothetical protein JSS83_26595 [Cyanobacteria bacterium SZAS LIN-3]|nr:hypothetical protein [Cyanobacteria bacterium SZAS LIN-3]